jgi:hypothetical protein
VLAGNYCARYQASMCSSKTCRPMPAPRRTSRTTSPHGQSGGGRTSSLQSSGQRRLPTSLTRHGGRSPGSGSALGSTSARSRFWKASHSTFAADKRHCLLSPTFSAIWDCGSSRRKAHFRNCSNARASITYEGTTASGLFSNLSIP